MWRNISSPDLFCCFREVLLDPPSKTHELVHYLLLSLFYYTSSYWWPCLISHIGLGTTWCSGKMTEPGPRSDGGEWWWNLMLLGATWQAFYTHQFISFSELFYRAFLFIWQKRKVELRNLGPAAWMKARTKFRYLPPKFFLFPLCCVASFQALKTWVPVVLPFKSCGFVQVISVSLKLNESLLH